MALVSETQAQFGDFHRAPLTQNLSEVTLTLSEPDSAMGYPGKV